MQEWCLDLTDVAHQLQQEVGVHLLDTGVQSVCGRDGPRTFHREETTCSDCLNLEKQGRVFHFVSGTEKFAAVAGTTREAWGLLRRVRSGSWSLVGVQRGNF